MKRFKKLTIYILVGVLLSSSVMLSYRKADEVKASATLTLGTGALIMLGILGAYGIVYKGNIDSALDEYVWKGDRGLYPHEVQEAEEWWAQMWNNTVRQHASNNGYDPDNWNDEDNDLETQPPLWEKVIGTVEKNKRPLKLLATAFGAIASKLAFGVYQESQNKTGNVKSGVILNSGDNFEFGYNSNLGSNFNKVRLIVDNANDLRATLILNSSTNQFGAFIVSENSFSYTYRQMINLSSETGDNPISPFDWSDLDLDNGNFQGMSGQRQTVWIGDTRYFYYFVGNSFVNDITSVSHPYTTYNSTDYKPLIQEMFSDEYTWSEYSELINQENIGLGTDITIDNSNNELKPISPTITIPTASMLDKLLNDLESSYGNESGTQQAVDDFIADLEYTEPNPEPEPDPEPNPNPNPNPEGGGGTTTDPDDGGEGGSGSTDDKDNSSLLADLKNVFPFCIPFDLVNCFKLFNAEPVTPRVEIPLHFGIIDKDYTFVIDLKDFDGVAEVCRAMFLILFIVGLVLSTRSLIRG